MHPIQVISAVTRFWQRLFPKAPVKGITRLSRILQKYLHPHEGIVKMNPRFMMRLNSRQDAEMSLIMLGAYQPALSNILAERLKANCHCLDLGANLGFFSLWFASLAGSSGKVAAFEANPNMAMRIREAAALNGFQLDIVEKAVDEESGKELSFYISSNPGKSSIYADNVQSLVEEIRVKTICIDDYIAQSAWPKVDVMKVDVEGNDCFALLGAEKTIRQHRPFIVFEYSDVDEKLKARLGKLFIDSGYRLESLQLNGKRQPFNWQVPRGLHHVDVLAFPE